MHNDSFLGHTQQSVVGKHVNDSSLSRFPAAFESVAVGAKWDVPSDVNIHLKRAFFTYSFCAVSELRD